MYNITLIYEHEHGTGNVIHPQHVNDELESPPLNARIAFAVQKACGVLVQPTSSLSHQHCKREVLSLHWAEIVGH